MNFPWDPHYNLKDRHALLSASKYAWLRYDDEKLVATFQNAMNAQLGTRLHELAKELIELGIKLPRSEKTLNAYVNDAIGYKMRAEQVLYYSDDIFGTADAISFDKAPRSMEDFKFVLRIHDLKNGATVAKMDQLLIYACIFLLEYRQRPEDVFIELRIYQNDDIDIYVPEVEDVIKTMNHIIHCGTIMERLHEEA